MVLTVVTASAVYPVTARCAGVLINIGTFWPTRNHSILNLPDFDADGLRPCPCCLTPHLKKKKKIQRKAEDEDCTYNPCLGEILLGVFHKSKADTLAKLNRRK